MKKNLASLQKAEHIRKCRRRKEKVRSSFFKNPFKHVRQLLEDRRSGKLEITQSELENHIRVQYSDPAKLTPLGPCSSPRKAGWKAITCPLEFRCRGLVWSSTVRLIRDMGCIRAGCRKAIKELAEEIEKGSFWLWLRRKHRSWGPSNT